jgi:hypothetical protein
LITFQITEGASRDDFSHLIARQREHGGRLILYEPLWAAIIVVGSQDRIEWVPIGKSRHLAGWRHSLLTCLLGIWSFPSVIAVPMALFANFLGGIDVTEFHSNSPVDCFREMVPVPGTAAREAKRAQWAALAFLVIAHVIVLSLVLK